MPGSRNTTQAVVTSALPTAGFVAALLLLAPTASAEATVPLDLQVALLSRVVRFERGFGERAGREIHVVVLTHADNSGSARAASQLGKAFEVAHDIAGVPIKVVVQQYSSPAALKLLVDREHAQVIYLTGGFDAEIAAIAAALDHVASITVATDPDLVDRGAVLGFELLSARPKIVLNLGQARRQGLDFNSDLFRLARVIK